MMNQRKTVKVNQDTHALISTISAATGMPGADIVHRAVLYWIQKPEITIPVASNILNTLPLLKIENGDALIEQIKKIVNQEE